MVRNCWPGGGIRTYSSLIGVDDKGLFNPGHLVQVLVIANVYDVGYNGGKLEFGLDDGTGRIRAYLWDVEGEDAERELAEHESQCVAL